MDTVNTLGLSLTDFIRMRTLNYRVRQNSITKKIYFSLPVLKATLIKL